jgi:hypothetical protein
MLIRVSAPGEASGAALRALHLSLNSPVVQVAPLPVGPASAAIALHATPASLRVTLALRSERGAQRAFYAREEPGGSDPEELLDVALSFAEGMGFLFDDDEVETHGELGPREGARIWLGFTGVEPPDRRAERGAPSAASRAPEPAPGPILTKFRSRIAPALARRQTGSRIQLRGRF